MIKELGADETLELLASIVEKAGEDHTARCYYKTPLEDPTSFETLYETIPQCIVGQAAYKVAGVEGLCSLVESQGADSPMNVAVLRALGFTYSAVRILHAAQMAQDSGRTWGEALARATSFKEGAIDAYGNSVETF